MSTAQQKFDIAQTFTQTEQTTLRVWLDLDVGGFEVDADRFLHAGLMLEHFQSRLSDVPSERSADDLAKVAELQQAFQNELDLALNILRQAPDRHGWLGGRAYLEYAALRERVDNLNQWATKMSAAVQEIANRQGLST